eukprot:7707308-Pyramimonas_sp.AAC.1
MDDFMALADDLGRSVPLGLFSPSLVGPLVREGHLRMLEMPRRPGELSPVSVSTWSEMPCRSAVRNSRRFKRPVFGPSPRKLS